MKSSAWRSALFAGCVLLLGAVGSAAVAADPAPVSPTLENSALPHHVTVRNSHGQVWADLHYAWDNYEYYQVYSPTNDSGGELRSDHPRSFTLNGPEHWSLEGTNRGFTLYNDDGAAIYRVDRWFKQGESTGPTTTYNGVEGDWKVTNARTHRPIYFIEQMDHDYNVFDKNMHIISIIKPTNHGIKVMDKGNKTWWTVRGNGVGPLSASFMALRGVDPWGRLLMSAYFFPDWW